MLGRWAKKYSVEQVKFASNSVMLFMDRRSEWERILSAVLAFAQVA